MPERPRQDRPTTLSTGEAARRAGVSARTLYRYEADGLIVAIRLPRGHRRFRIEDIDALFQTQEAS